MCNKAILEKTGHQNLFLTAAKIKKICNKVVDKYVHALDFVPDCYKTQKMRNKTINTSPF